MKLTEMQVNLASPVNTGSLPLKQSFEPPSKVTYEMLEISGVFTTTGILQTQESKYCIAEASYKRKLKFVENCSIFQAENNL